jgi:hypothetical protein
MASIGFLMILINATSYIFGWETKSPALSIMGIVFLVVGTKSIRKSRD